MKRLLIGAVIFMMMASVAMAGQIKAEPSFGPYQAGDGGEFTIIQYNDWLDLSGYSGYTTDQGINVGTFQTFCIEGNEFIYDYIVYDAAIGTANSQGVDITLGVAWLYSQFATGTWEDLAYPYDDAALRIDAAALLQNAIWYFMHHDMAFDGSGPFMAAVNDKFADPFAASNGEYNVYALILTTPSGGRAQDLLVYRVPDGGATVLLLGLAFAGVAALRRRFQ
jgi:hypothetical protein